MTNNNELVIFAALALAVVWFVQNDKKRKAQDAEEAAAAVARARQQQTPEGSKTTVTIGKSEQIGGAIGAVTGGAVCAVYAAPATPLCAAAGGAIGQKVAPYAVKGAKATYNAIKGIF